MGQIPREPKPPAEPIEMPRTEDDLDVLMTAVEVHKIEGHKIGEQVREGFMDVHEAMAAASIRDARLYDTLDQMAYEREEEFVDADEQLKARRKSE